MAKLCFISILLFFLNKNFIAQTGDTTYLNKFWKPCKKDLAKYFRIVHNTDSLYEINDFYKSGVMQMKANASSINPEILEGQAYYFYPNGTVKSSGTYHKDKPIGVWTYYDANGDKTSTYNYNTNIISTYNVKPEYEKFMSEKDKNFSVAIRGKLFGFFIIEDTYFSTATLGTEFLIKGRHSLGVDFTYFGWQNERDDMEDSPLYETYERRSYMYVDYKCRLFSYKKLDLYFNMYDKYGTYHMWQEGVTAGYNAWEKPWLADKTNGTFNQVGTGLGVKVYLSDRFYIDGSANGGKLFSDNNTITHDSLGIATQQFHLKSEKNIFYIRVNFGYKLFIKMKKKEDIFYTN